MGWSTGFDIWRGMDQPILDRDQQFDCVPVCDLNLELDYDAALSPLAAGINRVFPFRLTISTCRKFSEQGVLCEIRMDSKLKTSLY